MRKKYLFNIGLFWLLLGCITAKSQILDAELIEVNFLPDGNPEQLTRSNNGFYFTSQENQLWFSDGTVDGTYLIKDFQSGSSNEIMGITPKDDLVFFSGKVSALADYQLWVSDKTEAGTIVLTNRNVPSSVDDTISHIIVFNGLTFFGAYDETQGNELWVSDGTPGGTVVFKDIVSGTSGSFPRDFFVFNGQLFFEAYSEEFGQELWVTDGTPEGTVLFKDINPGPGNGMAYSEDFIFYDNHFYFYADNGTQGLELWKSDGTSTGTVLVKDIRPGLTGSALTLEGGVINGKLIFAANDGTHGKELWISDGTEEGTTLVKDINSGQTHGLTYDSPVVTTNSAVFFVGYFGPILQVGVYASDGTPEGTVYLGAGTPSTFGVTPSGDSAMYYALGPNNNGGLWLSDGSLSGSKVIASGLGSGNNSSHETSFISTNNATYFSGRNQENGTELWVSDGTDTGTSLLKDLNKTGGINARWNTSVGQKNFFACSDSGGRVLGVTDGTADGTKKFPVIVEGRGTDDIAKLVEFGDKLIFVGYDSEHGYELWTSDGTEAGTYMIKDIIPGASSSLDREFTKHSLTKLGNKIYFSANINSNTDAIWVTDGTPEGTVKLADIRLSSGGPISNGEEMDMPGFTLLDGHVYFLGIGNGEQGLFKTQGTPESTEFIYSVNGTLRQIYTIKNRLLMVVNSTQLYFSDGTTNGSGLFFNFSNGFSSGGEFATIFKDELYFVERNQDNLMQSIFKTDGTFEGTVMVYDGGTHPTPNTYINDILTCGNYIYFGVRLSQNFDSPNLEIWRSDGTTSGTIMLATAESGLDVLYDITCMNKILYFLDDGNKDNIWATNGNPGELLKLNLNVTNGQQLSENGSIQEIGTGINQLYLAATSEESGAELYVTRPASLPADMEFADSDSDGIVDFFDTCESTPAGEQVNELGCSESQLDDDEDGVANSLDLCPGTMINEVVDENGCSNAQIADDDNDGIVNANDLCPNTASGAIVNEDGCAENQLDEDGDGVMNDVDICPGTEDNLQVDASGCPIIFNLPGNNFTVQTIGETCVDKSNGQILIGATEPLNYVAKIANNDYFFTSSLTIDNLTPGTYSLCIGVQEHPEFSQCFNVTIEASESLTGKSATIMEGSKAKESFEILSGTAPFRVQINGQEVLNTQEKSFALEINDGDRVQISSLYPCEGIYEKTISTNFVSLAYPNPTGGEVKVFAPGLTTRKIQVELYNSQLQLIDKAYYEVNRGEIEFSLVKHPAGIYFLKVGEERSIYFKLVKL